MIRLISVLILVVALCLPVSAQNFQGYKINPNDQVMVTFLSMIMSDLNMCQASLRTTQNGGYVDNVLAIGHLNNAQSALRRTDLDPAYAPLINEIQDRLGKIKFYILMSDLDNVSMRIQQLMAVIRTVLTATVVDNAANNGSNGGTVYQYPTNSIPGGVVVPNMPGFPTSSTGGWNQPGQQEIPVGQALPNLPQVPN